MSGFSASREGLWNHAQKVSTIYFEKGTWQEIDLTEAEKIDYTAKMLTADPKTKVILTGHASAEGTADSNRTLSINRAMKVKTLLAAKGVDPKMITANGLGSSQPVARENGPTPEAMEAQRQLNRRVTIEFSFLPEPFDIRSFVLSTAAQFIQDMIKGKRVLPWPRPDDTPPKRTLPDPKPQLKPDEWKAVVKKVQDALEFRGIKLDPEKIMEIIKEGLQLPTPDNQGPVDEDFEKEQRRRQLPPSRPDPPD